MSDALAHDDVDYDALYPDGKPLPQADSHQSVCIDAVSVLRQHFDSRTDVFVAAGLNHYYREHHPASVVEPDLAVYGGVQRDQLKGVTSYRSFQHGGHLLFVLEIASPSTRREDAGPKRDLYADLGAAEYWRVDPTGGDIQPDVLVGERLLDGRWTPIAVAVGSYGIWRGHSTALGLDVAWDLDELTFHHPGSRQPLHNLARAEAARRDAEAARLDAEAEVARLEERLRRQGHHETS